MLATTHIAVTLLLIMALNLNRTEALVALTFGVFIDFDHLFGLGSYVRAEGAAGIVDVSGMMSADVQWKSVLHSPVALGLFVPMSDSFRFFIPIIFWGTHISLDYIQQNFLGIASLAEMILFSSVVVALIFLRSRDSNEPIRSPRDLPNFIYREVRATTGIFFSESKAAIIGIGRKFSVRSGIKSSSRYQLR
ncbi:MAG TPA: hypothetical protein ENN25_05305 [Euryarchaeota archaeon]|mgnify:CR=1 FL=1|nr:hypothetical protein [Euryarchaeota archaeon]